MSTFKKLPGGGSPAQSIIKPPTSNLKPKSQVEVHSSVKQQF